ncbi:MAG: helix-turn-helix domain-containing protein [Terriglobia bacterium]
MKRYLVKIGIANEAELRKRSIDIAAGRRRRQRDEPKVWFTSMRAVAEVLSEKNRELLRIVAEEQPGSVRELAVLTGRAESNLSRTLKTLAGYGFVRLERKDKSVHPVAHPMEFEIRTM